MLSKSASGTRITTKYDGAPAIFCGTNPENGKFFVGTKSVFNKTPKINYTNADIDRNHPSEGLNVKLKIALKYLKRLGISGVLQGDMMFTHSDLSVDNVGGEQCVTFTPNTITYAVPVNTTLAKEIQSAKLGIIFHTTYSGKSMSEMHASFGANVRGLKKTRDVWFNDADYVDATGQANLTAGEQRQLDAYITAAEQIFKRMSAYTLNYIAANDHVKIELKAWNNKKIRAGQPIGDIRQHIAGLIQDVSNRLNQEIVDVRRPLAPLDARKAPRVRRRPRVLRDKFLKKRIVLSFYQNNIQQFFLIYQLYNMITDAKNLILRKLNSVESMGSFLRTSDGYKATNPEGYVAINAAGSAVKLVDRLEFSHANFTVAKDWK